MSEKVFPGMQVRIVMWPTEVRESQLFVRTIKKQIRQIERKLARQNAK